MNVFISWSGTRSRDVATALGDWLPQVLHAVKPFVSTRDVSAGTRWAIEIGERLEETDFGIVCVTRENQSEPWLNYEAGAIAKAVEASRVVPLAINLSPAEIVDPLSQFQGTQADERGIAEIVKSMNEVCPSSISETHLAKALEKWWPDLRDELEAIENRSYEDEARNPPSPRGERAILEEVLTTVRGLAQRPYLNPPNFPKGELGTHEEIGAILRSTGIRSWQIATAPKGVVEVKPGEPLSSNVVEQLTLLGDMRGVKIQVVNPDSSE